jgi:hypothetical protein
MADERGDEGSPSSLVQARQPEEGPLSLQRSAAFQEREDEIDADAIVAPEAEAENPFVQLRC